MNFLASIWTAIQKLIPKEINFIKIDQSTKIGKIVFTNNSNYNPQTRILNVDIENLDKRALREILESAIQKGHPILENQTNALVSDIAKAEDNDEVRSLLNYFEPILPPQDYDALRASLILRTMFRRHNPNIDRFKSDIILRWGNRGRNICNLCTGGYFEKVIKPLYEQYKSKTNGMKLFEIEYEEIVTKTPMAVFIHGKMKPPEIKDILIDKLESSKYGIHDFNIHCLKKETFSLIKTILDEISKETNLQFKYKVKKQTKHILFYQVHLDSNNSH